MKKRTAATDTRLERLRACLDSYAGFYKRLRDARDFRAYLTARGLGSDEEILTEQVLASIIEQVLGFPQDGYFRQLRRGGVKPDFTPFDQVAHPFVLDAKSSDENLRRHELQIRRYIAERALDSGVLFNLHEIQVYRRGASGNEPELSFALLPLWELARGERMPTADLERFQAFCDRFAYREMDLAQKIDYVATRRPWVERRAAGEPVEVDVEFLVARLRLLARELADDAAAQAEHLDAFLRLNEGRAARILGELQLLANDLAPGVDLDGLPDRVERWRSEPGLAERAWRQYLLRVAYLALARILLYRAWEDVHFVREYLYDGGFGIAYERLSKSVRRVLGEAFREGADQYQWLFGPENNYDWFRPREPALVEVLYSLAPFPLGELNADVLGGLYVSYVDEIDRDRLGQFFTPRSVVRFMLDRAGFAGAEVFRIEGDARRSKRVLDFATGSGGFLVEAARRIIDEVDLDDPREVEEGLAAIAGGFVGGEISAFPYYLTEVNLLLQVSRLLGRLEHADEPPPRFVLKVLHVDTLTAKSGGVGRSFDVDPALRGDRAVLVQDPRFDLVPLDGEKLEAFRSRLREDGTFDLVVGNPPYVAEANNKPLFERLRAIPAWKGIYRGKTDYLYYFLLLAVEKVAPGGRLCVITPAGWMNAGAAGFLREKLSRELRLDELYLFGSYRLFAEDQGPAPTPTVESLILVATKAPAPEGQAVRVVALEGETQLGREALLAEMARRARGKPGRKDGILVHDIRQSELSADRPWPVKHAAQDVAAQVVAHLQRLLDAEASPVEALARSWKIFMGIETGADAYTRRIRDRLGSTVRERLEASGASLGDPILQLPPGREQEPPWSQHPGVLAKAPEARAVLYGALDDEDYTHYVRLDRDVVVPAAVLNELDRWRVVLSNRAEIARNPGRKWWETAWPRDARELDSPKVIAVHRTDRGRFALDEGGMWMPGKAAAVIVGRLEEAPVAYLCGLLNSEFLDLWYALRGRHPRDVWRDYEPKPMGEIPYRRPKGDPRAERIAALVREIAANRRALLPHRPVVPGLDRIVKDPWKAGPVEVDRASLIRELPPAETISARLDPSLEVTLGPPPHGRPHRETARALAFRRGRVEAARVAGAKARLDLLEEVLGGKAPDDLGAVLLPRDADAFERAVRERAKLVGGLLAEGRRLVEEVERLVCALYELPDELTEEVVTRAVARAARG